MLLLSLTEMDRHHFIDDFVAYFRAHTEINFFRQELKKYTFNCKFLMNANCHIHRNDYF